MNLQSRHLISAGVLFSALAFSGATFAQSSGATNQGSNAQSTASSGTTSPGSNGQSSASRGTTSPSSGAQGSASNATPPSSTNSSMNTSSNRSASNTATPAGSAASGTTGSQASSSASDRSNTNAARTDRTQASSTGTDTSRANANTGANATTQAHAMRASKIVGANVENANGDNIGEIKDMVVDMQNERVRYVVLSHGGVLGIGDKLFAYPMSMVKSSSGDGDKLVMNVNKDKLENAPGFDKNKWPDFADSKYTGEIDKYYGAQGSADSSKPAHLVRASDLIGKNFDDRQGKDAGEVDDLIVDASTGRVEYAVVDFDDSWNKDADGKLVAIPLKDLAMSGEKNDKLVIQTTHDRIDMSHAFTKSQWPNFNDPAWNQETRSPRS